MDAGSDLESDAVTVRVRNLLSQFDPENDEQWTPEGLPVVAYIAEKLNNQKITRAVVDLAAPGFTRRKARDLQSL